jgi:2-C-methyl-D-erythritol 4-phosphate cytidylyltransferase
MSSHIELRLEKARVGAIIVAAGRSERMGGVIKPWAPLVGSDGQSRPLLAYPLRVLGNLESIDEIVVVVSPDAVAQARDLAASEELHVNCTVVPGGVRRQDSVRAGLDALDECTAVVVHDGARPLVTPELIERGIDAAMETGASCCAIPAPDTVKEADGRVVTRTLERSKLWLAQTPQVFGYDLLMKAHEAFIGDATDDAAMVEALGVEVRLFEGSSRNMKVTTQDDLALVQALLLQES